MYVCMLHNKVSMVIFMSLVGVSKDKRVAAVRDVLALDCSNLELQKLILRTFYGLYTVRTVLRIYYVLFT
jgi:hypothetical protein